MRVQALPLEAVCSTHQAVLFRTTQAPQQATIVSCRCQMQAAHLEQVGNLQVRLHMPRGRVICTAALAAGNVAGTAENPILQHLPYPH